VRVADLSDFASVQNDDGVVIQDALQAVSDGDDGLAAEVLPDDLLHDLIGVLVDGARRFVQDQDLAGIEQRARQAEQLLLALREVQFGDVGGEAVGALFFDQFEELDDFEGVADCVDVVHVARVDVVADAALDEDAVLGDGVDAGADVVTGQLGDVEAVDEDLAGAEVEHAEEGHGQGGFATGRMLVMLSSYI